MSTHIDNESDKQAKNFDLVKWIIVFALLAVAVVGNSMYSYVSLPIRTLAVIVLIAAAGAIALFTTVKGKTAVVFAKEARIEMKKVIWPTRTEATQTTLMVVAISVVVSLLLWGFDGIAIRLVKFITSF